MNIPTFDPPEGLGDLARRYKDALLSGPPLPFAHPETWREDEIGHRYAEFRENFSGQANVYAIWTIDPNTSDPWRPRYVGQRESGEIGERMRQHLVKRSEKTGSMLNKVNCAVSDGLIVGVSFVMVKPEALRHYVEEFIITSEAQLDWNTHMVAAALRRERAGRPSVSAAEIRAARDLGRP